MMGDSGGDVGKGALHPNVRTRLLEQLCGCNEERITHPLVNVFVSRLQQVLRSCRVCVASIVCPAVVFVLLQQSNRSRHRSCCEKQLLTRRFAMATMRIWRRADPANPPPRARASESYSPPGGRPDSSVNIVEETPISQPRIDIGDCNPTDRRPDWRVQDQCPLLGVKRT